MNQNKKLSQITIAAGVLAALGSVVLLIFFTGIPFFGWLGDLIGVITAVLLLPFFIGLGNITLSYSHKAGRTVQILGVLAALLKGTSSFLIITNLQSYEEAVIWEYLGSGMLGIVVIAFILASHAALNLRRTYVWFSCLFGVAAASNFAGIIFADTINSVMAGNMNSTEMNPLLYLLFALSPIYLLGYPIWLLWTGRLLLKGQQATAHPQTV